jgi:hypothetical protein
MGEGERGGCDFTVKKTKNRKKKQWISTQQKKTLTGTEEKSIDLCQIEGSINESKELGLSRRRDERNSTLGFRQRRMD